MGTHHSIAPSTPETFWNVRVTSYDETQTYMESGNAVQYKPHENNGVFFLRVFEFSGDRNGTPLGDRIPLGGSSPAPGTGDQVYIQARASTWADDMVRFQGRCVAVTGDRRVADFVLQLDPSPQANSKKAHSKR